MKSRAGDNNWDQMLSSRTSAGCFYVILFWGNILPAIQAASCPRFHIFRKEYLPSLQPQTLMHFFRILIVLLGWPIQSDANQDMTYGFQTLMHRTFLKTTKFWEKYFGWLSQIFFHNCLGFCSIPALINSKKSFCRW